MRKTIEIINSSRDGVPEILLHGDIMNYEAGDFVVALKEIEAPLVRMRINSFGGDVNAAYAIVSAMNAYYQQGGEIETINEAMAGSAAGWIFAFGTRGKRKMLQFAQMMLHQPKFGNGVGIDDLPEGDEDRVTLEGYYDSLVNIFTCSTGLTDNEIRTLMDKESYISAESSVQMGFADEVITISNAPKLKNDLTPQQIVNACTALDYELAPMGEVQKQNNKMKNVAKVLNLAENAGEADIAQAVQNICTERDSLRDERDSLQQRVNTLESAEKSRIDQEIQNAVDDIIASNEGLSDQREALVSMARAGGIENLRSVCAATVVNNAPIDQGIDETQNDSDAAKFKQMSLEDREALRVSNRGEFDRLVEAYEKSFNTK